MSLLTLVVCLSAPGDAECQRSARYVETPAACREIADAMAEYLIGHRGEGIKVSVKATCARGVDG